MNQKETDLPVKEEDLVELSRSDAFLDASSAGILGMLGFFPFSVGTGLFVFLFGVALFVFLLAWFTAGYALAAFTYYVRPRILRKLLVGRDFAVLFRQYRRFL